MDQRIIHKLDNFFSNYPALEYKKGETIIQADVEPLGIYYIREGVIRRYWISENGEEVTLNLYKPHAFLPMSWAICNVKNLHFYECLINTKTNVAPKEHLLSFLKKEPDIMYDLLQRIYNGMEGLWMHIKALTAGNSYTKITTTIMILGKRFGKEENGDIVVQLKMSEQDIANYAGMSRETASRELQKLKREHIVTFEKGIINIHNMKALEEMAIY